MLLKYSCGQVNKFSNTMCVGGWVCGWVGGWVGGWVLLLIVY